MKNFNQKFDLPLIIINIVLLILILVTIIFVNKKNADYIASPEYKYSQYDKVDLLIQSDLLDYGYTLRALYSDQGSLGNVIVERSNGELIDEYYFESPVNLFLSPDEELFIENSYILYYLRFPSIDCFEVEESDCITDVSELENDYKSFGGYWIYDIDKSEFQHIVKSDQISRDSNISEVNYLIKEESKVLQFCKETCDNAIYIDL